MMNLTSKEGNFVSKIFRRMTSYPLERSVIPHCSLASAVTVYIDICYTDMKTDFCNMDCLSRVSNWLREFPTLFFMAI